MATALAVLDKYKSDLELSGVAIARLTRQRDDARAELDNLFVGWSAAIKAAQHAVTEMAHWKADRDRALDAFDESQDTIRDLRWQIDNPNYEA